MSSANLTGFGLTYILVGLGILIAFYLRMWAWPRWSDRRGDTTERIWIAASAMAIVLIFTGIALITLYNWRPKSSEQPPAISPALEEFLRARLPDPEMQEKQHREIIDAIREARPSSSQPAIDNVARSKLSGLESRVVRHEQVITTQSASNYSNSSPWFYWVVAVLWFTLALGVAAYVARRANWLTPMQYKNTQAVVLTFGIAASGITLFRFDSVFGITTNPHVEISIRPDSDRLPSPALLTDLGCGTGDAQRIEPFSEGGAALEENARIKLKSVVALLKEQSRSSDLLGFVLIGANVGLAQPRIKTVQDELAQTFDPDKFPVMALYAGPSKVGLAPSANDLVLDRAVQICAVWNPRS
jgi:hypothetical protein